MQVDFALELKSVSVLHGVCHSTKTSVEVRGSLWNDRRNINLFLIKLVFNPPENKKQLRQSWWLLKTISLK